MPFSTWGTEFRREATPRQIELMDWMTDSPITAIFGAHPHVDSGGSESWRAGDGLVCRSLGNVLFDQTNGSGAPAELRFFDEKTFADAPAAYRPDFLGHLGSA